MDNYKKLEYLRQQRNGITALPEKDLTSAQVRFVYALNAEIDRIMEEMQTPRVFKALKSEAQIRQELREQRLKELGYDPVLPVTPPLYGDGQPNTLENEAYTRGFSNGQKQANRDWIGRLLTRTASLLSELGSQKSASLAQAKEARELIHLIGKEIGAKNER